MAGWGCTQNLMMQNVDTSKIYQFCILLEEKTIWAYNECSIWVVYMQWISSLLSAVVIYTIYIVQLFSFTKIYNHMREIAFDEVVKVALNCNWTKPLKNAKGCLFLCSINTEANVLHCFASEKREIKTKSVPRLRRLQSFNLLDEIVNHH